MEGHIPGSSLGHEGSCASYASSTHASHGFIEPSLPLDVHNSIILIRKKEVGEEVREGGKEGQKVNLWRNKLNLGISESRPELLVPTFQGKDKSGERTRTHPCSCCALADFIGPLACDTRPRYSVTRYTACCRGSTSG